MPKVSYAHQASFFSALKKEIDSYFLENKVKKSGNWNLYSKTIILFSLASVLYVLWLWPVLSMGISIIIAGFLGFILALIGFNVMHDACHGSYSSNALVNEILGYSLNLIGGNSFIWKQKHNVIHHTYTNVDGVDDDIARSPFMRMCRTQRWLPMHKIQHLYLPLLYSLSTLFWMLWQDFRKYFTRKVYTTPLTKMATKDHVIFWISKLFYIQMYIVLPIFLQGWFVWLIGFLVMNAIMGLTTATIFQMAHVVEETEFKHVGLNDSLLIENEWAIHQIKTTSNFSPGNPVLTYLVGGLNYQVEHHLFPRISHVHYPSISKIVKQKCREFNITYLSTPRFFEALSSHVRLIRKMGTQP